MQRGLPGQRSTTTSATPPHLTEVGGRGTGIHYPTRQANHLTHLAHPVKAAVAR